MDKIYFYYFFLSFFEVFSFYKTCIWPSFHICLKGHAVTLLLFPFPLLLKSRTKHFQYLWLVCSIFISASPSYVHIYVHINSHLCEFSNFRPDFWHERQGRNLISCFHPPPPHVPTSSPWAYIVFGVVVSTKGPLLSHYTDSMGRWVSDHTMTTYPSQQSSLFCLNFCFCSVWLCSLICSFSYVYHIPNPNFLLIV